MPFTDTVKVAIQDEVTGIAALAKESAVTGTYLYPLRGIAYFLTHRAIWEPLTSRLLPLLALSTGVITLMFLFTYIPQSFLLTFVNGPIAWISTIALVLSESAVIITALSRVFLIDEALVDIFDGVLLLEGMSVLVKNERELGDGNGIMGKLGVVVKKPFEKLSVKRLVSYLIWLPVNFIPIVGTVVFIFVQGRKLGPTYHARYFQLKGYSNQQKNAFVERNKPAYISFGTVSMLFQLVPIVSILFSYTNTVGAALWAVDIERGNRPAKGKRIGGIVAGGEKEL